MQHVPPKRKSASVGIFFFFPIMKSNHHAYSIKCTYSMSTPMLSYTRQNKRKSVTKSYVTVRTLTNKRGIPWNSYNYAQPEAQQKTERQPVCAQAFHDNNKLVGFTSHLLFMLFDGVWGSLHERNILQRIHVWLKEAAFSKACRMCVSTSVAFKCE